METKTAHTADSLRQLEIRINAYLSGGGVLTASDLLGESLLAITQLTTERDAAVKDAQRYRWLRIASHQQHEWWMVRIPAHADKYADHMIAAIANTGSET